MATLQLDDPARLLPHVEFEIAKSPASAPDIAVLLIEIADVPRLLSVTVCAAPVEPRATLPQLRLSGLTRAPTTTQPVKLITHSKRAALRSKPVACVLAFALCFAARFRVISSSFIRLAAQCMWPCM
jgi:hypothetical protein